MEYINYTERFTQKKKNYTERPRYSQILEFLAILVGRSYHPRGGPEFNWHKCDRGVSNWNYVGWVYGSFIV